MKIVFLPLLLSLAAAQAEEPCPEPVASAPWWTLAPLGIPQLGQRRWAPGLAHGALQLGVGVGSIALYARLLRGAEDEVWVESKEAFRSYSYQRSLQWTMAGTFWVSWIASSVSARASLRRDPVTVVVGPSSDGGTSLSVAGRW